MYNRYVPQEDGSFRKSRLSEPENRETPETVTPPPFRTEPLPRREPGSPVSIGSFFSSLLPKGLDTEDLIVILLLLLISEKQEDESNQALLTLGAYLFL